MLIFGANISQRNEVLMLAMTEIFFLYSQTSLGAVSNCQLSLPLYQDEAVGADTEGIADIQIIHTTDISSKVIVHVQHTNREPWENKGKPF